MSARNSSSSVIGARSSSDGSLVAHDVSVSRRSLRGGPGPLRGGRRLERCGSSAQAPSKRPDVAVRVPYLSSYRTIFSSHIAVRPLRRPTASDVQSGRRTAVASRLSRVAVTGGEGRRASPRAPRISCSSRRRRVPVDLGAEPEGRAHVALRGGHQRRDRRGRAQPGSPFRAEDARAAASPSSVRERQRAAAREVTIDRRATPSTSRRPSRGIPTQEIYTLSAAAAASEDGTRRLVGVAGDTA